MQNCPNDFNKMKQCKSQFETCTGSQGMQFNCEVAQQQNGGQMQGGFQQSGGFQNGGASSQPGGRPMPPFGMQQGGMMGQQQQQGQQTSFQQCKSKCHQSLNMTGPPPPPQGNNQMMFGSQSQSGNNQQQGGNMRPPPPSQRTGCDALLPQGCRPARPQEPTNSQQCRTQMAQCMGESTSTL